MNNKIITIKRSMFFLVFFLVALTGCSALKFSGSNSNPKAKGSTRRSVSPLADLAWVPLGLSKEAFAAAEIRMQDGVHVGMLRGEFLERMKLTPLPGVQWADQMTSGEGWFSGLSRRNKYGNHELEEYSFGYFEGRRLKERFAVIVQDGVVGRLAHSPKALDRSFPAPSPSLLKNRETLEGETQKIKEFYRNNLQSRKSFERILPRLKRIRPGWTSAEVRLALGGSLYRMPNGLIYLQEGLLWDDGFAATNEGLSSVVILPFGYRDPSGKAVVQVVVRAEGGIVTAVLWQAESEYLPGNEKRGKSRKD
jgi:hypothetical protein